VRRLLNRTLYILSMFWHYALQRQKIEMAYRADFIINLVINLFYSVVQLFFLWALFARVPTVRGWTFEQVVLIYGFGQLSFGWFMMTFGELVAGFSDYYVIEGNLDRPLMRPLSPLIQLVMENLHLRELSVVIKGTAIIWWALAHITPPIRMSLSVMLAAQLLGVVGAIVYSGVFLAFAALGFWVKDRVGFTSPLFAVSDASRWPITIYSPAVQFFFSLVVPFGFCAFYPSMYFTDPARWGGWLAAGPPIALLSFACGVGVFYLGLRTYESTGS